MVFVFLCFTIVTTPNLPSPSVLIVSKSSTESFWLDFLLYSASKSLNLLGGDLESELLVEVGDPTFLNLYSYDIFGTLGV